jgi:hypothetical protein
VCGVDSYVGSQSETIPDNPVETAVSFATAFPKIKASAGGLKS